MAKSWETAALSEAEKEAVYRALLMPLSFGPPCLVTQEPFSGAPMLAWASVGWY